MKRIIKFFLITILIICGVFAGLYFYYTDLTENPLTDPSAAHEFSVLENEGLYQVISRLEEEGLLRNARTAKIYYRLSDKELGVKPGKHVIKKGGNLDDLLEAMKGQDISEKTVTIPEGFTIDKMGEAFEKAGIFARKDFIEAVKNFPLPPYVREVQGRRYAMEGFLKPDTYTFSEGYSPEEAVKVMSDAFEVSFKAALKDLNMDLSYDKWDETVVKASMIERETATEDEMPLVASVIENRLKEKMPLQIDATILYAVNDPHKEITMDDILLENPYNTYHVEALPIGPISAPSSSAIKAALKPEKTDYIFYVLNPRTGRHYFTKDYDDFLVKRDDYLGYSTVPKASTPSLSSPVSLPSSTPFSVPGYSSNTLNEDSKGIKFPKLRVPYSIKNGTDKPLSKPPTKDDGEFKFPRLELLLP